MQSQSHLIEFLTIYNRYKTMVFNYVLKMCGNRSVTDDIVQSVFLKLYEHLPTIRDKAKISFWIFKCTRNEIYSHFRAKRMDMNFISAEDHPDSAVSHYAEVELQYELNNLRELVKAEINLLPNEQKEVLLLREYSGLSYREIGEILQIDEDLVKSRLFNARKRLVQKLQPIINE